MKACQDCKHFNPDTYFMAGFFKKRLTSDAIHFAICGVNAAYCGSNRVMPSMCGVEGLWFQPSEGENK